MTERAPFSSVCPKCGQDRVMSGSGRESVDMKNTNQRAAIAAGFDVPGWQLK
jgi:hypothetical protein